MSDKRPTPADSSDRDLRQELRRGGWIGVVGRVRVEVLEVVVVAVVAAGVEWGAGTIENCTL